MARFFLFVQKKFFGVCRAVVDPGEQRDSLVEFTQHASLQSATELAATSTRLGASRGLAAGSCLGSCAAGLVFLDR